MLALILFALSFAPSVKPAPAPHWRSFSDGYFNHQVYLGGYGDFIGDFYETRKGDPFTAQCDGGVPTDFTTESEARNFVENCPR